MYIYPMRTCTLEHVIEIGDFNAVKIHKHEATRALLLLMMQRNPISSTGKATSLLFTFRIKHFRREQVRRILRVCDCARQMLQTQTSASAANRNR